MLCVFRQEYSPPPPPIVVFSCDFQMKHTNGMTGFDKNYILIVLMYVINIRNLFIRNKTCLRMNVAHA